jgi:uncharacterized membrane protein (UPF0136 family)
LLLATVVNAEIAGDWLRDSPETSWRWIFLCGLAPAVVAFAVRFFVKEPERWAQVAQTTVAPRYRDLFTPEWRRYTVTGTLLALTALVMWWSCNAFIPVVVGGIGAQAAAAQGLSGGDAQAVIEAWKTRAIHIFNFGGFVGTLLTVPAAKYLGRRAMFGTYFLLSALSILCAFGLELTPEARLWMYLPIGLTVFGVFGSFTYYLPELFPTRLRGTGAGFCYNFGRFFAAAGPFIVGSVASRGADAASTAIDVLFWVGVVPLVGLLLIPFVAETKDRPLLE